MDGKIMGLCCELWGMGKFACGLLDMLAGKCGFALREYHVSKRYSGSTEMVSMKRIEAQGSGDV